MVIKAQLQDSEVFNLNFNYFKTNKFLFIFVFVKSFNMVLKYKIMFC